MSKATEGVASAVVDAAIRVHRVLGPGLYENVYEVCLERELTKHGHRVRRQVVLPVTYEGEVLEAGYRVDLIVDDVVIVELKAAESLLPVHEAQLLTYLRFADVHVGFLMNFHSPRLRDGLRRFVR